MAIINRLENTARIEYNGNTINSLPAETLLLVLPTILKTVDAAIANIGDTLTYTVTITNLGLTSMTNIPFTDVLPTGSEYVDNSFKLNGSTAAATLTDNTLTYTIPSIAPLGIVILTFQVTVIGGET